MSKERMSEEGKVLKPKQAEVEQESVDPRPDATGIAGLQQSIGNRAVQRLLAQRSADGAFELDDATAGRINQARGGGQPLDTAVQKQMGAAMGHDFSGVNVHTGSESNELNRDLSARAFTSGQDVFFRQGDYDPGSDSGRELIAHELTHVVQQSTGAVTGGQKMTVNPPGDVHEQEADSVAQQVAQRQLAEEDEAEDVLQGKDLQRQPEEEEEPEDALQGKDLQRQPAEENEEEPEEPLALKPVQRQEEIPDEL
jgi:hypothetical protein